MFTESLFSNGSIRQIIFICLLPNNFCLTGSSNGKDLEQHLWCTWFEARPGHQLSWLRFFVFFFSLSTKILGSVSIRPKLHSCPLEVLIRLSPGRSGVNHEETRKGNKGYYRQDMTSCSNMKTILTFSFLVVCLTYLRSWRWQQYILPKHHCTSTVLQDATTH